MGRKNRYSTLCADFEVMMLRAKYLVKYIKPLLSESMTDTDFKQNKRNLIIQTNKPVAKKTVVRTHG